MKRKRINYRKAKRLAESDLIAIVETMSVDLCEKVKSDIFKNDTTLRGAVTMLVALQIYECNAFEDAPMELRRVALTLLYQNRLRQECPI